MMERIFDIVPIDSTYSPEIKEYLEKIADLVNEKYGEQIEKIVLNHIHYGHTEITLP